MQSYHSIIFILSALVVFLPALGCTRSDTPPVQEVPDQGSDFFIVTERIESEAKAASVGDSTVLIRHLTAEVDGHRTMTATRVCPAGTTNYNLQFRRRDDRWICCGATAEETSASGSKYMHRLGGDAIEIEQLIIWIGWRAAVHPNPAVKWETPTMGQMIPTVSDRDVERIIVRDFGSERLADVLAVLHEYGRRDGTRGEGSSRVHLAILKIANGDFAAIQKYTDIAIGDFRDVVAAAEYPFPHLWVRNPNDPNRTDTDDQANLKQYQEWLNRK